jgi:hypothetical protein
MADPPPPSTSSSPSSTTTAPASEAPSGAPGNTPASSPASTAPKPRSQPDPAKVKDILAHKAARSGSAPATDATSPPIASSPAKSDATPGDAAAPKADSSKSSSTDGDPDLALRLAKVARAEDRARSATKEAESVKTELVEYRGWKEARAKDPVAAATAGLTPEQRDAVFWALNKEILEADPGRAKDPLDEARRVAREELERIGKERTESDAKAQDQVRDQAAASYVEGVATIFNAGPTKWPAVAAWGIQAGDIHTFAQEQWTKDGTVPDATTVLDHFEKQHQARIEAAGYTRQKVEAQPGGEGTANGTKTITNEWSAGAGTASGKPDHEQSRRESSEAIKKRHFKR